MMTERKSFDYMNAANLPQIQIPLVTADVESLQGFDELVSDYKNHQVEIVTWPTQGWRSIDVGTGDEGGHADGIFKFWWEGDVLLGENESVNDGYLLGWSKEPSKAIRDNPKAQRNQLLMWHANYHPDGAQLFYPLDGKPFVAAFAKPGDGMTPTDWVAFYFDGSQEVCIHPGVWHEAIIPLTDNAHFYDKQGKVHARVSCDFGGALA